MKRIACYLFFVIVVLQASPSCIPSQESLTERKIEEIEFKGNYPKVYLKRIERGLNYCASVISLSPDENFEPDYEHEYVFIVGEANFFYKVANDTIRVKTYVLAKEPDTFSSTITIIQEELNQQELELFKRAYEAEGYSFFGSDNRPKIF